jgi:hypothetical protein
MPGLLRGEEAMKQLDRESSRTQHTALAALSLQMWDLGLDRMALTEDNSLLILASDRALFEGNTTVLCPLEEGIPPQRFEVRTPPLGYSYLQDLNLPISEDVLTEHLDQLKAAVIDQFANPLIDLSIKEVKVIQQVLFDFFGGNDALSFQGAGNALNATCSHRHVRQQMERAIREAGDALYLSLEKKGLDPAKVQRLRGWPFLLKPKSSTIRQIQALLERRDRLRQFLALRAAFKDFGEGAETAELDRLLNVVGSYIESLPTTVEIKLRILEGLSKAIHGPEDKKRATLRTVQELVSQPLDWNTLAKCVYPMLASLHAAVKDTADADHQGSIAAALSHTMPARAGYSRTLRLEIDRLKVFRARPCSVKKKRVAVFEEAAKQAVLRRALKRYGTEKAESGIETEESLPALAISETLKADADVFEGSLQNELQLDSSVIIKPFQARDRQRAVQVETLGAMASFLSGAKVVAARRSGTLVLSEHVAELRVGREAIRRLDRSSLQTQHTAAAALVFQMWDLHQENIGIGENRSLVIFDTDLALLEDNRAVWCEWKDEAGRLHSALTSPMGHSYLQVLNPTLDETVLSQLKDDLKVLIDSQIASPSLGLTPADLRLLLTTLFRHFLPVEGLSIHGKRNSLFAARDLIQVKQAFGQFSKRALKPVFEELEQKGLDKEKLARLRKNPMLLHPKSMSFRQLFALVQRHGSLSNFLQLRGELQDFTPGAPEAETRSVADFVFKRLDALPLTVLEKQELFQQLRPQAAFPPNLVVDALLRSKSLVCGPVEWNTLAKSMYPTLARLQLLAHERMRRDYSGDMAMALTYSPERNIGFAADLEDELERYFRFRRQQCIDLASLAQQGSSGK